jgi:LuxR family transcriptional regulator, maltose regulon positive regulatory protein
MATPPPPAPPPAPPNVAHAVVRSTVLDRLDARWDHPVTTVVAGAGFGKSVALGQALRANRARPRGIEGWVTCRTGCETPERLAASVEAAFGATAGGGRPPLDRIYAVVADLAPLHVSLLLDDVELLGDGAARLVDELLQRAPANLHLVLCGRRLPALSLARLRAADDLVEVGADELRFEPAEAAALATSLGVAPLEVDLAGWPALIRLALVAPRRSVDDFIWEEVIAAFDPGDRAALLALSLLGASGVEEVEAVVGRPFDLDGFCARVPLVHQVGDQVVVHDLWAPYVDRLGTPPEVADASRRVLAIVAARGDPIAAGALALRLGATDTLARAAIDLVRDTLGSLPIELAETWMLDLRDSPGADDGGPVEAELLACALAHARSASEPPADRLDALAARFHTAGDGHGEAVALALASLAADARKDIAHLLGLGVRARALAAERGGPHQLPLLVASVDAGVAAMSGDLDRALAILAEPVGGIAPHERPEGLVRLHWHFLLLAGRAGEAAELTAGLDPVPGLAVQRELHRLARWLDGEPEPLATGDVDTSPARYRGLSERDTFDQAAFTAVISASAPDPAPVRHAVRLLDASPFATGAGPDGALLAAARACAAVVDHDDEGADAAMARFVDHGPLDPFTDAHLRRTPAVPYVCSAELRRRWDAVELGPSQTRALDAARLLLAARAGSVPAGPPTVAASACTALPFPWTVELSCRVAARAAWGADVAVQLTDLFGDAVAAELDRRLADPDASVRRGAAAVLQAMPARPATTVSVGVLGPLEVRRDGRMVDTPELHRIRVRELLSLLVVDRTVSRDRAIDLLWPELDPDRGRANLRVTLRHLRRVLEPDRTSGSAPYLLRGDAHQLRLAPVPGLEVDCWEAQDHLDRAEAARRRGDASSRVDELRSAVARWRGRPLPDLDRMVELDRAARHLESRLLEAAVTLGELELVGGAADAAGRLAERVLAADPYAERAHRLAVAAALYAHDRAATTAAADRLCAALDDLGVDPEEDTRILLRNASRVAVVPGRASSRIA